MNSGDAWCYPFSAAVLRDSAVTRIRELQAQYLVEALFQRSRPWVLDLGTGDGTLSSRLTGVAADRPHFVLLDRDLDLLRTARRRLSATGARVQAVNGDFELLPIDFRAVPKGGVVLAFHILYYSPDWRRQLTFLLDSAGAAAAPMAIAVRTRASHSYRLRRIVREDGGQALPVMLEAEMIAHYLQTRNILFTRCEFQFSQTFTASSATEWRSRLRADDSFRDLLSLLMHCEPSSVSSRIATAVCRSLRTDDSPQTFRIYLEDELFIIDPCKPRGLRDAAH